MGAAGGGVSFFFFCMIKKCKQSYTYALARLLAMIPEKAELTRAAALYEQSFSVNSLKLQGLHCK